MANGVGGGLFRGLLGVVAVGLIGYNTWEIGRLRTEISVLKRKDAEISASAVRPAKPLAATPVVLSPDKTVALFGEARRHAERAEAFLRRKKYDEARREIALVALSAKAANRGAQTRCAVWNRHCEVYRRMQGVCGSVAIVAAALAKATVSR